MGSGKWEVGSGKCKTLPFTTHLPPHFHARFAISLPLNRKVQPSPHIETAQTRQARSRAENRTVPPCFLKVITHRQTGGDRVQLNIHGLSGGVMGSGFQERFRHIEIREPLLVDRVHQPDLRRYSPGGIDAKSRGRGTAGVSQCGQRTRASFVLKVSISQTQSQIRSEFGLRLEEAVLGE